MLQQVADEHGLYLDYKKLRPIRNNRRKCSWQDRYGNLHDLDYVLERGGSEDVRGLPAAFIETAWRAYTKHSRNKVQEIQGAVVPLAETYAGVRPFLGAILVGVFTEGSLKQLRDNGFCVAYLPGESVVQAFRLAGLDASFDERTSDAEFQAKIDRWDQISAATQRQARQYFFEINRDQLAYFKAALLTSLSRQIDRIRVIALHGSPFEAATVEDAVVYVESYREDIATVSGFSRYEVDMKYNNGDVIQATFQEKSEALRFLRTFAPAG